MKVHSELKATSRGYEFEKTPAQEEQQRVQDPRQSSRMHRHPGLTCTLQSSTDRRAEQWSQRCQRDKKQIEAIVGSLRHIRTSAVEEERQDVTPDERRFAIRDMKTRTDAWSPALLAALSRQGMAALADLIHAMET